MLFIPDLSGVLWSKMVDFLVFLLYPLPSARHVVFSFHRSHQGTVRLLKCFELSSAVDFSPVRLAFIVF